MKLRINEFEQNAKSNGLMKTNDYLFWTINNVSLITWWNSLMIMDY